MAPNEHIASRRNPRVMLLDSLLRQKKAREENGLFVLEGVRLCLDAFEAGISPELIFATPEALSRSSVLSAVSKAAEEAGTLAVIGEELAARISDTGSPQGVFAICKKFSPPEFSPVIGGNYILLSEIRDPGNLGSILRTAAALGMDGAILCGCAELFAPKVLRASMGGVWRIPVYISQDIKTRIDIIKSVGIPVYAAAIRDNSDDVSSVFNSSGAAILVGNEGAGLARELIDIADMTVSIKMNNNTESLGAAMAAGILMWEAARGNRLRK